MKNLSLNLRRVRSTVRTDVNTGVSVRKGQNGCAFPSCVYGSQSTGIAQPPAGGLIGGIG